MVKRKEGLADDSRELKIYHDRVWVPMIGGLRDLILIEAHKSKLSIHPGSTKMYNDLKKLYWWPTMKTDIAHFMEKCQICVQVKAEHQKPYGSLRQLEIPEWKWEHIIMDFVTKLPQTLKGNDMIWTAEKVAIAREKLKAARDRQKMYADPRRRPVIFLEGESVYLKVSPWKGVIRFSKCGKLAPRYISPFRIRKVVNDQTVMLDLPSELSGIHDTFNVCYLRKCKVDDESQILPLQDLKVDMNKKLVEEPVKILDRKVTKLQNKQIPMVLVEWKHSLGANLTWETEELMKSRYPHLFHQIPIMRYP
ncbi:uncharacterized protein [Rutidosis leptorrhynchoides]|uniref:uncharacterized protein n=1 Tax=Rutidosis leptorrhynchoides TaxID=125765 RepID=UPI003A99BE4C